ncbi:MAG: UvrD-helicase domain-containing protein [Limnospira sp.]
MSLTSSQATAANAPKSVVVTAGAGTGKTHMLAERYLYYLRERKLSPLEIVAVTFTEKAATELRSRIRSRVTQELPFCPDILAELEAAPISTIHALASRICREHPQSAGVPADFRVLEDLEGQLWLSEGLEAALSRLPIQVFETIPYSLLSKILAAFSDDPLMAERALNRDLNWSEFAQKVRDREWEKLIQNPQWEKVKEILTQNIGKSGDKLEAIRQATVAAMFELERGENIPDNLEELKQINLRVGSKKNWGEDVIGTVKDALKTLREDLIKSALKQNLITLEVGAADRKLTEMLVALKESYREVKEHLQQLKWHSRVLTFPDLEIGALNALQDPEVQTYYRKRWQAFLVDEFQDTNPVQGELLEILTETADLTVVGDRKQSIYGFRRADIRVFEQYRDRILAKQGTEVILGDSFRSHPTLIHQMNRVFYPLLEDLRQNLNAVRIEMPSVTEPLQVFAVSDTDETPINHRRIVEGNFIAKTLKSMLESQTLVFDKQTRKLRPVRPGDIAILTRTWEPLEIYGEALAAAKIPVAPAGGGNLLKTREAKDAWSLLRFLADTGDDIALVAVLRSPFFALSDRLLLQFSLDKLQNNSPTQPSETISWWQHLNDASPAEFEPAIATLKQLLKSRDIETPSRLLQIADRLTGYTASIANLPGSNRREADWNGFRELVRTLERGTDDLFGVVRRLKRLGDKNVKVERPPISTENAVALMTIFAAKGLEWPVVVVSDLTRQPPNRSEPVYFDPEYGVAINSTDDRADQQKPILYYYLQNLQKKREEDEALRILYVALTRSRDYLFLTAAEEKKGSLDRLRPALEAANIPIQAIEFDPETIIPPVPPNPPVESENRPLLIENIGSGLFELPVTALGEYDRCPKRFEFAYIFGHPGLSEQANRGMEIGKLVHIALEQDIRELEKLRPFAESSPDIGLILEAINLAKTFDNTEAFRRFRETEKSREVDLHLTIAGVTFNGIADRVGENWVLDYKSDRDMKPEHHHLQLWAYSQALNLPEAHIAYLRHEHVYSLSPEILKITAQQAETVVGNMVEGYYPAKPSPQKCRTCRYSEICEDSRDENLTSS